MTAFFITLSVIGLSLVQGLETWRPGLVSGVISLGWIWSGSSVILLVAWLLPSSIRETNE